MSAVASGMISITVLHELELTDLYPKPFFPIATLAGAGCLGLGMHLTGACMLCDVLEPKRAVADIECLCVLSLLLLLRGAGPGTVFAQIGNGRKQAWLVFLGGLLGALGFGYAHPYILQHTNLLANATTSTVHGSLGVPMWQVAVPMAISLVRDGARSSLALSHRN